MTDRSDRIADWLETFGRAGWVAKGIVYVTFGLLAAQLVVGGPGPRTDADQRGALQALSDRPAGGAMLVVLALGLLSYAAWRLVAAVRPPDDEGPLERSGFAISAAWYVVLAWAAVDLVAGSGGDGGHTAERWSARLLGSNLGTLAVGLAGVAVVGIGIAFGWRAVRHDFGDDLDTSFVADAERRRTVDTTYRWLGTAGWAGRAILVAAAGIFAVGAAVDSDVDSAEGLDGLLRRIAAAPAGSAAVLAVACLLVVYGTYCALSAPARSLR